MNRRQFLLFSAAALSAVRGAAATAPALTLPLWSDQPPGEAGRGRGSVIRPRCAEPYPSSCADGLATPPGPLATECWWRPAADTSGSRWAVRPGLRRTG